ncbi:hypothetical protein PAHAL_2G139600 [Panicum hallii]|jgi:hypothetical protein|uniref:Uncharacterized protein n=1 Tax=Panicum hallii TaxID=206008 RepID=A0A2T8KP31_9POAL|nr:hypothetical protein PAHAL_2G139600 [Panicum hallii]
MKQITSKPGNNSTHAAGVQRGRDVLPSIASFALVGSQNASSTSGEGIRGDAAREAEAARRRPDLAASLHPRLSRLLLHRIWQLYSELLI